jgi:transposase
VKTIGVPWAEPGSRFTLLFERAAVEALLACHTVKAAEDWLKLDWDACQRIMERAVARGLERRKLDQVRYVGLDEKSFLRGQNYISLMTDVTGRRVLEVVPGNDEQSGRKLWHSLPEEQRAKVEAAAMDMWDAFIGATKAEAPHCDIVHDRFHVSKQLNDAVDQTRRAESARLGDQGDDSLKGTRYLWLKGTVPDLQQPTFSDLLERNLKTAKAWYYKELFVEDWYKRAIHTRLDKVKKVARTLKAHLPHLLTYFIHRITNAITEGFNSRIQAIKSAARGFRNFAHYRIRILFFCGKLDLMPICPV